ncbi:MAG: glycosyltransferase [Victivallaceae bacterium]
MSEINSRSPHPALTILIPQYKTLELSKLCLRSLKSLTDLNKVKVVVIDNDSADQSIEYLRSLEWITLIERKDIANELPAEMHARALDIGLELADTQYVLSIHTDTIVTSPKWLDFLLGKIEEADDIAGVGSWKLERKSLFRHMAKKAERFFQTKIWFPLTGKGVGAIAGLENNYYYLRSHCALYRTDLIKTYTNGFFDENEPAGKALHRKLVENGYRMLFIPEERMSKYMKHLNHATMILNPEIAGKKTSSHKARKRIMKELKSVSYEQILQDDSLD